MDHTTKYFISLLLGLTLGFSPSTKVLALVYSTGEQKVAVLLVNFTDDLRQPFSTADIRSVIFGTVNDFYKEVSFGQTWLAGEAYGWLTLPGSAKNDRNAIASEAASAAAAAGIDLSVYNRHVFIFPTQSFPWGGWAIIGGSSSKAWINGDPSLRIVAHELGHNLGLSHANALVFPGTSFDSQTSGTNYDQADRYDTMGKFGVFHFNARNKERLGWMTVQQVTQSGTYEIFPIELPGSQNKGLKFQTPSGRLYYVEYRQNFGFDQFYHPNVTNGVLIHLYQTPSVILDMTPETVSLDDPALGLGRSYTDPDGITISVIKKTAGSILVNIQMSSADQPPLVNAGIDQTITLPSTVQLGGNILAETSQNSSAILKLTWSLVSGPGPVNFDDAHSQFTQAHFYKPGSYVIELTADDGRFVSSSDVSVIVHAEPDANALGAIQNPFNLNRTSSIQISYKVDQEGPVALNIYNILGEKITTLDDSYRQPGVYMAPWDGKNASGELVAPEVYLVRLAIGDRSQVQKVVVVR